MVDIDFNTLPQLVLSAWLAFTLLGVVLGNGIEGDCYA